MLYISFYYDFNNNYKIHIPDNANQNWTRTYPKSQ